VNAPTRCIALFGAMETLALCAVTLGASGGRGRSIEKAGDAVRCRQSTNQVHAITQFVEIATLDHIAAGAPIVVTVCETAVAVFNVAGGLFAIDDSCVRCGSSLAAGSLSGSDVTCSGCDWRYDVTNGRVNGVPALRIDTFEVRTVGARVMVADRVSSDPEEK
jgi:3-phenylpropionate/trans-cinnamate dioxygenase ferredoxin component